MNFATIRNVTRNQEQLEECMSNCSVNYIICALTCQGMFSDLNDYAETEEDKEAISRAWDICDEACESKSEDCIEACKEAYGNTED